jgi:hypothetical protein
MRYDWRRHRYTNLCRHTGLTVPECSCPACIKRQIGRAAASGRKLNKSGTAKVTAVVTYTPTGDLPGVPNTETKRIALTKTR